VMSMVCFTGMLTCRSLISSVISLCLSLIVSRTRSLAALVELRVVWRLSRGGCWLSYV
jgi:hypothetical protein